MFLLIEFSWVVVLLLTIFAMSAFDSKVYELSAFFELLILGFIGWVLNTRVEGGIMSIFTVNGVIKAVGGYALAGVIVAFIQYITYCWRVKENYTNLLDKRMNADFLKNIRQRLTRATDIELGKPTLDEYTVTLAAKYQLVHDNIDDLLEGEVSYHWGNGRRAINDCIRDEMKIAADIPTSDDYEAALKRVLPPKFKMVKDMLLWSGVIWPVTLAWLLLFRFVRQIIERLMSWSRIAFDFFGSLAFGKL
jgi:hypothetical protein